MRTALAALVGGLAAQVGVGYLAFAGVLGDVAGWWTRPPATGDERLLDD